MLPLINYVMNNSDKVVIEKLTLLIESNLTDSTFTLERIYKELGVSRTKLHRVVKEQTLLSTSLFIRKIRLNQAAKLIIETDLRMSEIADLTGIDSPQNFSKYFTQEYKVSPTQFRKNQRYESIAKNQVRVVSTDIPKSANLLPRQSARFWAFRLMPIILFLGLFTFAVLHISNTKQVTQQSTPWSMNDLKGFDNSVVILPFQTAGENELFTKGVITEINTSLSHIKKLKVIDETSSGKYLNTNKSKSEIGNELGAKYVLQGESCEQNDSVRIKLQLYKTTDGKMIWTKSYEDESKNVFSLISVVVRDLTVELKQKIDLTLS